MEKHGNREAPDLLRRVLVFLRKCLFSVLSFGSIPKHIAFIMDGNRRFAKSRSLKHGVLDRDTGFSALVFLRKCLFSVLSFGPIPEHIAFIMDGNRRFAKSRSLKHGVLDRDAGFSALVSILQYCFEMDVKCVTVYAFSIDNFKRKPDEVQHVMDLMQEKIGELLKDDSIVHKYGVRINFWGNLNLLNEPVRLAAEKAMASTGMNTGRILSVCVAYISTHEILRSVQASITEKRSYGNGYCGVVAVSDLEKHMYTAGCPEPDIIVRTSGETRLSNFLLWQSAYCHLQSPVVLWPEFTLRHLVWAVLEYQKVCSYIERREGSSRKVD